MPQPLRPLLAGLDIRTAQEMGWGRVKNGELLKRAEGVFGAFVTADQSLKYQQNLTGRRLAILVLSTNRWPRVKAKAVEITAAIQALRPGDYVCGKGSVNSVGKGSVNSIDKSRLKIKKSSILLTNPFPLGPNSSPLTRMFFATRQWFGRRR